MAHIFEKAEKIAAVGLGVLQRQIVLPNLFRSRYGISDFKGAKGDVVNVKRPPILRARDAGFRNRNTLVMDDLMQTRIQVPLNKYPYSGVALSDEELTLDVENFGQDVTVPQTRALAEDFEESVAAVLSGATYVHEVDFEAGAADATGDPRKVAIRARKLLNSSNVPAAGRYWIVGADVSEAIASHDKLLDVDTAGLPKAVREGVVGRLAGFTIVESNALDGDESYFVHDSAVALAFVAPAPPQGATSSATATEGGLALRQLFDYDSDSMADRSIVSVFTGGAPVTDPQIGEDGLIVVGGDDEPVLEFVRAVRVTFAVAEPVEEPVGG